MNKLNLYRELIILVLVMFGVVLLVGSAHAAHCAFSTCDDNVTTYDVMFKSDYINSTHQYSDNVTTYPSCNNTKLLYNTTECNVTKDNITYGNITTCNVSVEHLQEQIKQLKDENQKLKKANTKLKQTAAKLIKQNNYLKAKNYDLKEGYSNQYKPYYKKCTALDYCNGCYPSQKIEINNY